MNTETAMILTRRSDSVIGEAYRTGQEYVAAQSALRSHVAELRAAMDELTDSLGKDVTECALRAVVAIQHGDGDAAYAFARAAAQCARAVDASNAILFGVSVAEEP